MSTPPFLTLPAGVETTHLPGGVGPLAALVADPASNGWIGTPRGDIVLVPGFTGSKEDFIAVLAPLAALGWRVTTYDQRGQYQSPGPDDAAAYSLDQFAADLVGIGSDLPGPVHVVGHSFGGLVAREAALQIGTGVIASLVLLCSGPGPIPVEDHVGLAFVRDQLPALPLSTLYDLTLQFTGSEPLPGVVGKFLRHRYESNNPWCLGTIAGHLISAKDRTDELMALAHAGLPVAVVYGSGDDAWPLAEQDAVAAACGTAAVVIPDAGHSPAVDQPMLTAYALDAVLAG
ncbi:MAG TPA: alpha/beta hydrolase [Candidatus Nanopelagicales bacterium]